MNAGAVLLVAHHHVLLRDVQRAVRRGRLIPKEMNEAAPMAWACAACRYLRRVFVPAVLPSLVTGCVTAWGGGWNAIILSEYVVAGGQLYRVRGIGATLDHATYVTGRRAGGGAQPRSRWSRSWCS